jgi:hypothetical protein
MDEVVLDDATGIPKENCPKKEGGNRWVRRRQEEICRGQKFAGLESSICNQRATNGRLRRPNQKRVRNEVDEIPPVPGTGRFGSAGCMSDIERV